MITPSLGRLIMDCIESELIETHVALPGKIQSYDASTQTADIELQVKHIIKQADGRYATEELPLLPNVPVQFPRSKDYFISFPLAAGDTGMVLFSQLSIDQWRSHGSLVSPGDIGRHTLTGGVFTPGLVPNSEKLSDASATEMVIGKTNGPQIVIGDNTITIAEHLTVDLT